MDASTALSPQVGWRLSMYAPTSLAAVRGRRGDGWGVVSAALGRHGAALVLRSGAVMSLPRSAVPALARAAPAPRVRASSSASRPGAAGRSGSPHGSAGRGPPSAAGSAAGVPTSGCVSAGHVVRAAAAVPASRVIAAASPDGGSVWFVCLASAGTLFAWCDGGPAAVVALPPGDESSPVKAMTAAGGAVWGADTGGALWRWEVPAADAALWAAPSRVAVRPGAGVGGAPPRGLDTSASAGGAIPIRDLFGCQCMGGGDAILLRRSPPGGRGELLVASLQPDGDLTSRGRPQGQRGLVPTTGADEASAAGEAAGDDGEASSAASGWDMVPDVSSSTLGERRLPSPAFVLSCVTLVAPDASTRFRSMSGGWGRVGAVTECGEVWSWLWPPRDGDGAAGDHPPGSDDAATRSGMVVGGHGLPSEGCRFDTVVLLPPSVPPGGHRGRTASDFSDRDAGAAPSGPRMLLLQRPRWLGHARSGAGSAPLREEDDDNEEDDDAASVAHSELSAGGEPAGGAGAKGDASPGPRERAASSTAASVAPGGLVGAAAAGKGGKWAKWLAAVTGVLQKRGARWMRDEEQRLAAGGGADDMGPVPGLWSLLQPKDARQMLGWALEFCASEPLPDRQRARAWMWLLRLQGRVLHGSRERLHMAEGPEGSGPEAYGGALDLSDEAFRAALTAASTAVVAAIARRGPSQRPRPEEQALVAVWRGGAPRTDSDPQSPSSERAASPGSTASGAPRRRSRPASSHPEAAAHGLARAGGVVPPSLPSVGLGKPDAAGLEGGSASPRGGAGPESGDEADDEAAEEEGEEEEEEEGEDGYVENFAAEAAREAREVRRGRSMSVAGGRMAAAVDAATAGVPSLARAPLPRASTTANVFAPTPSAAPGADAGARGAPGADVAGFLLSVRDRMEGAPAGSTPRSPGRLSRQQSASALLGGDARRGLLAAAADADADAAGDVRPAAGLHRADPPPPGGTPAAASTDLVADAAASAAAEAEAALEAKALAALHRSLGVLASDMDRTFPAMGLFHAPGAPLFERVKQPVLALTLWDSTTGYIQGLTYLASILALHAGQDPADTFSAAARRLRSRFGAPSRPATGACPRIADGAASTFRMLAVLTRQPMLLRLLRVDPLAIMSYSSAFDQAMRVADPELAGRLERAGVTADLFFYGWAQPLFARSLPLRVALRVWDGVLVYGTHFFFAAALAVLKALRPVLMRCSDDDCMAVITGGCFSSPPAGAAWCQVGEEAILEVQRELRMKGVTTQAITAMEAHMPRALPRLGGKAQPPAGPARPERKAAGAPAAGQDAPGQGVATSAADQAKRMAERVLGAL